MPWAISGHAFEGKHEARQQDRGQEEKEGHLHGLKLRGGNRRDEQAHGQIGGNEDQRRDQHLPFAAHDRHREDRASHRQDDDELDQSDDDVGNDLPEHQFHRAHRRVDQQFEIAPFAFAHDGDPGEQHHGHGQHDADQARHDVHRRTPFGIVEIAHFDHALPLAQFGLGIEAHRDRGELFRHAENDRIGAVDEQLQRRPVAGNHPAVEIVGNGDAYRYRPRIEQLRQFLRARETLAQHDHLGRAHVGEQLPREMGIGFVDVGRAQVAHIGVDGVAEQQQLDQRDAYDHAEGEPVPGQLQQLLVHDGEYADQGFHDIRRSPPFGPGFAQFGYGYEDILDIGKHLIDFGRDARPAQGPGDDGGRLRDTLRDLRPQLRAEPGEADDFRHSVQGQMRRVRVGRLHFDDMGIDVLAQGARRTIGHFHAPVENRQIVTAHGFVHVMRGHENRRALLGEFEQGFPEIAAIARIHRAGRLVEQQQVWPMHGRRGRARGVASARRSRCRRVAARGP